MRRQRGEHPVAEARRPNELEHDVERAAGADLIGGDDQVGTERHERLASCGVTHRGDRLRPEPSTELDGGCPNATCSTGHEEPIASGELPLGDDGVEGGGERLGEPAGRDEVDGVRDAQEVALVDDSVRGLPAASHDRHDSITRRGRRHTVAERDHGAGELEPWDVLGRTRRGWVEASTLQQVGGIHPAGGHLDEDLMGTWHGIGALLDHQVAVDDRHCPHVASSVRCTAARTPPSMTAHRAQRVASPVECRHEHLRRTYQDPDRRGHHAG